ncbi:MAG: carbamoyl phosphate synthase large subunit [Nitrososphaerota archaeon]
MEGLKKVLVLGSGPIKIGEAGEFDYSGSQCLKALREEGIQAILVNPNVATIQTDPSLAHKVYLLPIRPSYVERVIEAERPDGILLGFGGQSALNCGVQLAKAGVLDRYGVRVLGTPIRGIEVTEDRALFKQAMLQNGLPVPRSEPCFSPDEALRVAERLGYPVMVRVAYMLGGRGSGVARSPEELRRIAIRGCSLSMNGQILVEEYIGEWKQIEYEVMRDGWGNAVTPCNMENIFAMRVHTGDNVVIAPSQTLTNREYQLLRDAALKIAAICEVVGECNVQFALERGSEQYRVIEVNARLSRSSALASKATGYPLAYLAAKLALGYRLWEVLNKVTGVTKAFFEPALDYLALKVPRWDFGKFERPDRRIGTQMKSVGEVMAIARSFEEALQKAARMLDIGRRGFLDDEEAAMDVGEVLERLRHPTDSYLFDLGRALELGLSPDEVSRITSVDPWFLSKMQRLVELKRRLRQRDLSCLEEAKELGFSDAQIAKWLGLSEAQVRKLRKARGLLPSTKAIDTLAGEWPARTNYLYMTYRGGSSDALPTGKRKVIVLGAGVYRIGSSVEFDWCTVNLAWALKRLGIEETIVVNCNPETVSTDYDESDRLYFEELTLERVLDIWEREGGEGIITCVGGQVANSLTPRLHLAGVPILGTSPESVDRAEDRSKFSALLEELEIPQPPWAYGRSVEEALGVAGKLGYPILARPSYILGGRAMGVAWSRAQLEALLRQAFTVSPEHPVVLSKFVRGALEAEIDAVSDGHSVYIGAVLEHLEPAGVHSGDATMTIPPLRLSEQEVRMMEDYAIALARRLSIRGPFNVQYLVKEGRVQVIECNLRSSRSMPFTSKAMGVNLMELAARAILGNPIEHRRFTPPSRFAVKAPQFSFTQLEHVDPVLGVEMRSTGEAACFSDSFEDALLMALEATGIKVPEPGSGVLISAGGPTKSLILGLAGQLRDMGYRIFATEHTAEFLRRSGLDAVTLYKASEPDRKPNVLEALWRGEVGLVINIPFTITTDKMAQMVEDEYLIRRWAADLGVPTFSVPELASAFVSALRQRFSLRRAAEPLLSAVQPLKLNP